MASRLAEEACSLQRERMQMTCQEYGRMCEWRNAHTCNTALTIPQPTALASEKPSQTPMLGQKLTHAIAF